MKPIKFDGHNMVYAKDQPEYLPLPVYKNKVGNVTSCWGMSLKERLKVLFTGKIFVSIRTFNNPLQPQRVTIDFEDRL